MHFMDVYDEKTCIRVYGAIFAYAICNCDLCVLGAQWTEMVLNLDNSKLQKQKQDENEEKKWKVICIDE